MSATPEDTAFVAIKFWCDDPDGTDEDLRAIIAKAIKDAGTPTIERRPVKGEIATRAYPESDAAKSGGNIAAVLTYDIWDGEKWLRDIDPFNPPALPT